MRKILLLLIMFVPFGVNAGGLQDQQQGQGQLQAQGQGQHQKASAKAIGVGVGVAGAGVNYAPNVSNDIPEQAIAPNPHAAPPSASCWIGASITAAVSEFGIGISGMEWDPICGLWLAAQQVEGEPQNEAATAAFCMTMEKAEVASLTCKDWAETQEAAVRLDPDHRADIDASITGNHRD